MPHDGACHYSGTCCTQPYAPSNQEDPQPLHGRGLGGVCKPLVLQFSPIMEEGASAHVMPGDVLFAIMPDSSTHMILGRGFLCSLMSRLGIRLGNGVIQNKDTIVATKAGIVHITKKKNGANQLAPYFSPLPVTNIWVENTQKRVRESSRDFLHLLCQVYSSAGGSGDRPCNGEDG